MREVWPKFALESFFEFGFPYPGELSYGWRSGLIDIRLLMKIVDEASRRGFSLAPEELEISFLLSGDSDAARGFADGLQKYEGTNSCDVWQYYVCIAIKCATSDLAIRFDLIDSAWGDLGYPEQMREVVYPEGEMPSRLDVEAGTEALEKFINDWQIKLRLRPKNDRVPGG